jgi:predicted secreted hydrolase
MKAIYILIILVLSVFNISAQNWQTYPFSPSNTVLSFPSDDGKHTAANTKTEWWYTNLHVIGSAPDYKVYDVMLCYFNEPGNMRIFNIAMPATGIFHTNVINLQALYALSVQTGHWELTYNVASPAINDISKWTYPTDNIPYRYSYHTENPTDNDGLDITVTGNRPPLNVGGDGFIPIGTSGDSSYYYSYTNMKVEGTIKFGGVTDVISSGIAWIDRQWGPFSVGYNPNNKYEWFSMQVDQPGITWGSPQTPSEFNIWQIFSGPNTIPAVPSSRLLSGIYPDESQDTTSGFFYERTSYWYDPSGSKYYSSGWRLINPLRNINLDMTPTIPNQVVDVILFRFWEGATTVKGVIENQDVEGIGFAELIAAHDEKIETPSVPAGLTINPSADHNTISWNASTNGSYPIGGYRVFRSDSDNGHWKYLASTTGLSYDDYSTSQGSAYYYTVTSFDNQSATSASDYASSVFVGIKNLQAVFYSVKLNPNPATTKINITSQRNLQGETMVSIFSVNGALIQRDNFINLEKAEMDVSAIPRGIYIIKIQNRGSVETQKLVLK